MPEHHESTISCSMSIGRREATRSMATTRALNFASGFAWFALVYTETVCDIGHLQGLRWRATVQYTYWGYVWQQF